MSPWTWLLAAGVFEIAWSQSLKPTDGFTKLVPTLVCIALSALTLWCLARAARDIPIGTAYAVFTGMGAVGAVSLGVVLYDDPLGLLRFAAIGLIVSGVVLLRVTE
jgi:quaternary ammonium compound-resistance protein SugE